MALSSGELTQIVWAETKALGTAPADGTGSVNGVRRLIARLAAADDGTGFGRRDQLPSVQDRESGDTVRAILSIAEDARSATAPQSRLIIWEADGETLRLNKTTSPPPLMGRSAGRQGASISCIRSLRTARRWTCSHAMHRRTTAPAAIRHSSTR